jgi:hypothetical protein
MKWVTREHVKVDRVACPWLIRKFIDKEAEFLFVPSDKTRTVSVPNHLKMKRDITRGRRNCPKSISGRSFGDSVES